MKDAFNGRPRPLRISIFLIIVLALYAIVVSILYIYQQVIAVGVAFAYVDSENISKLVNDFFQNQTSQAYYSEGTLALNQSGYSGFSLFYLARPLFPILVIVGICFASVFIFGLHNGFRLRQNQKREEMKLIEWIQSNKTEKIKSYICSDAILRAISEQKRKLQRQEEIHREDTAKLMHYMEDISHQLKTPLSVMQVACERLSMQDGGSKATTDVCLSQVSKMTQMIQDLLQLGRFDCNKQPKKFCHANVQELLEIVVNDLDIIAAPKNITLEITGDPAAVFYCDPHWIKEAVGNILKNCIEHSSDSKISIQYDRNETANHIIIKDHGSGFTPDFEKYVFQRYAFRHTASGSGSGLGMAIALEAIKMHYGMITASNRPEGGAVFRITFPQLEADAIYS